MKNLLLSFCRHILMLMGFAVLGACRVEYGSPYSTFRIDGKVHDENMSPVEGIEVSVFDVLTKTSSDGSFLLTGQASGNQSVMEIHLEDVDGEENGGDFGKVSQSVTLEKVSGPGKNDSSWYTGEYAATVDITLEPRK